MHQKMSGTSTSVDAQRDSVTDVGSILSRMRVVDLAPKLEAGIPNFPLHPPLVIDKARQHARDGYYCQMIVISEHTGAHVDAPAHMHADRPDRSIDRFPANCLIAPAVLYDFAHRELGPGDLLTRSDFEAVERRTGVAVGRSEIALVNFGWMSRYWRTDDQSQWFVNNSPGIAEDAVILFKERGIRAIGCDTVACEVSVVDGKGGNQSGHMTHWLPNDILIIEMLCNLEKLSVRSLFVATPLKIHQGSGSPIRPLAFCAGESPTSAR
jgi:kynurenine formamidase